MGEYFFRAAANALSVPPGEYGRKAKTQVCRYRERTGVEPPDLTPDLTDRLRALSGFIGRKALVGGLLGRELNPEAQPPFAPDTGRLEF